MSEPSTAFAPLLLTLALAGCATTAPVRTESARTITANVPGADFYVSQGGALAPASVEDGVIVLHLRSAPFELGTNSHQVNVCLTEIAAPEIRTDPGGYQASCLSGPMQAAQEPDSDEFYVYSGKVWSDGNCVLMPERHRPAAPRPGYAHTYQVNEFVFIAHHDQKLATFRGTIHGHIAVYRGHERRPEDVRPLRLVFDLP